MKKILAVPVVASFVGSSMGKLFDNPLPEINVGPCPALSEYPSYKFNTAANLDGTYYVKYYSKDLATVWGMMGSMVGDLDTSNTGLSLLSTSTGVTYDVVMEDSELGVGDTIDCGSTNSCSFGINDLTFPFIMVYNGMKDDSAGIVVLKMCYESITDMIAPLESLTGYTVPVAIITMFDIVSQLFSSANISYLFVLATDDAQFTTYASEYEDGVSSVPAISSAFTFNFIATLLAKGVFGEYHSTSQLVEAFV